MKKLLTILALVLALSLICCAGLAEKWADLTTEQQALVQAEYDAYKVFLDSNPDTEHTHHPNVYNQHLDDVEFVITDATCAAPGSIEILFHKSDYADTSVEIAQLAHDPANYVTTYNREDNGDEVDAGDVHALGCTTAIIETITCGDCGAVIDNNYIPKGDHDPAAAVTKYFMQEECWDEIDPASPWAKHNGYWQADVCANCGEIVDGPYWNPPIEGHWYDNEVWYIIKGGVKVYEDEDWATFNEYQCVCEVYKTWRCDCGSISEKTEKVFDVRGHVPGTWEYVVSNPDQILPGSIDEQATLCGLAKNRTLVKRTYCANCFNEMKSESLGNGRGGHNFNNGDKNNAAHWAYIDEQPTCREEGWAYRYCTYCGEKKWDEPIRLAKLDHEYTVKVYNCAASAQPTCKNGLTVKFDKKCILCRDFYGEDYYEGGRLYPTYPYSEKLTPVELINLEWGHKAGTNTYEYANGDTLMKAGWTTATDIDGKPTYDDDGHFYIPTAKIERKFACEPAEMQYYSCIYCGKEKLVIHETSTMMNRPDWRQIKYEYVDCTHVAITYQCRICEGKFELHSNYVETKELAATNGAAHYANEPAKAKWDEVIEAYVAPTCTKAGSKTFKCMHCGETKKVSVAAVGHVWAEWELITEGNVDYPFPPDNSRVFLRTCQICGATESTIIPPGEMFETKTEVWKKSAEIKGDCQTPNYVQWTLWTKDAYGEFGPTKTTKEYYGAYGDHIMAHKVDLDKAATCTTDGIEYYVCTVCGGYDTAKKEFYGHYETKVIPAGHTWGEWKVTKEATPTAAGEETRTCTVCKATETKAIAKLANPAKYEVEDLDYTNPVATGSVKLEKDTDALAQAYARVTFFLANGDCMIQIVEVDKDNNFTAGAIGNFVHISVVIVDTEDAYGADEAIEHAHGNGGIKL